MAYAARVIADSLAPCGKRLTTIEATLPKYLQGEFNTHRMLSKGSASSRAIPFSKMLESVVQDPVMPVWWGKNQSGMQAREELSDGAKEDAIQNWLIARDNAAMVAHYMSTLGVHKQIVNRLIEPFMFVTVLVTATEWENFYNLRLDKDAQPELRATVVEMRRAMDASVPSTLREGEWHLPLVNDANQLRDEGYSEDDLLKICVGRCARISYLTHDGRRAPAEDLGLFDRLMASGHMGPTEHPARALSEARQSGNFVGWEQYRKTIPGESVFRRRDASV